MLLFNDLPEDIQILIYSFDPTYYDIKNKSLHLIKNYWGIVSLPYIGKPRSCLIKWGISKEKAENLSKDLSLRSSFAPHWSYVATYYDEYNKPIILNYKYQNTT